MKITKYLLPVILLAFVAQAQAKIWVGTKEGDAWSWKKIEAKKPRITVTEDDTFMIKLQSNPSTGYSWKLISPAMKDDKFDTKELELISTEYFEPKVPRNMTGAPGMEVWTFKAKDNGRETIKMKYTKKLKGGEEVAEEKIFRIRIKNKD